MVWKRDKEFYNINNFLCCYRVLVIYSLVRTEKSECSLMIPTSTKKIKIKSCVNKYAGNNIRSIIILNKHICNSNKTQTTHFGGRNNINSIESQFSYNEQKMVDSMNQTLLWSWSITKLTVICICHETSNFTLKTWNNGLLINIRK